MQSHMKLLAPNHPGKFIRWLGPWRLGNQGYWIRTARLTMPDGHECNQLIWGPRVYKKKESE